MVYLETVTSDTAKTYIEIGLKSYNQHYLHLWENRDPTPYVSVSFTPEVLNRELINSNAENFLVKADKTVVGIVKLIHNEALDEYKAESSLLVQKIYLLQEHSGMGYGHQLISLLENHAKRLGKKMIWLDTMQKGPALNFYLKNGFSIHKATELMLPNALEEERPMWILTKML